VQHYATQHRIVFSKENIAVEKSVILALETEKVSRKADYVARISAIDKELRTRRARLVRLAKLEIQAEAESYQAEP
jgi:hypothetical protein